MGKHKTTKARNTRQKLKGKYQKVREDAQLAGLIPTTPEGAVKSERVDPSTQESQQIPSLDRAAISKGWSVPEEIKRQVIERLAEPFQETDPALVDRYLLKENAKALILADQRQWERDNPVEAGKAKGSSQVQVNVLDPMALFQAAMSQADHDEVEDRLDRERKLVDNVIVDQADPGAEQVDVASGGVLSEAKGVHRVDGAEQRNDRGGGE